MVKPIGNQSANVPPNDKVGFRTREKFAAKSLLQGPAAGKSAAKKPVKYKTRKAK